MNEELQAARTAAMAAGWKVVTVVNDTNRTVHQLYDGQGNYIVSQISEELAWKRAFKRGHLGNIQTPPPLAIKPAAPKQG